MINNGAIAELEREVSLAQKQVISDEYNLAASDTPLVDKIFLSSSSKLLQDLQRKLHHVKAERAHELVRVRLIGNKMTGSIPLKTLLKVIAPLNSLLEQSSWKVWDKDGEKRKIDEKFTDLLDLRLQGLATGSTEIAITGNTAPDLTGVSALEEGLSNIFTFLNASNDEFSEQIHELGTASAKAISDLMSEFEKHSLAAEFKWNAPSQPRVWQGRPLEITRIKTLLKEFGEPTIESLTVRGKVQVLSVRNRIEIEVEAVPEKSSSKIVANFHHSLFEEIRDLHLGDKRDFVIERTTYPSTTRKNKSLFKLKEILLLDFERKLDSL